MSLTLVYTGISWILLRWHQVFSFLAGQQFLRTDWDWLLAIVLLVVTVRIVLFPLVVRQIRSQRAMQALQPRIRELQTRHKRDHGRLQRELTELYRRDRVNPLTGCLPILVQAPVFISLFWVLRRLGATRTINTDLYTWTHEQFHSASMAQVFGAPLASRFFDPDFARFAQLHASQANARVVVAVLVLIMAVTTHLTARHGPPDRTGPRRHPAPAPATNRVRVSGDAAGLGAAAARRRGRLLGSQQPALADAAAVGAAHPSPAATHGQPTGAAAGGRRRRAGPEAWRQADTAEEALDHLGRPASAHGIRAGR
jgi:YidC/Oxa1 family membrane protein insertase